MSVVFLLQHERKVRPGCSYVKTIGVFTREQNTRAAIQDLISQPGFRDHATGFTITPMRVDHPINIPDGADKLQFDATEPHTANVHVVVFERRPDDDCDSASCLGAFSSSSRGMSAIADLKRREPESWDRGLFHVVTYKLDRIHWAEGFGAG